MRPFAAPQARTAGLRFPKWTRFSRLRKKAVSTPQAAYLEWRRSQDIVAHRGFFRSLLALLWQFKGAFRGISMGYGFHIGKAKRRRHLWKRKNCQSSARAGLR